jgi:hypothetical protein
VCLLLPPQPFALSFVDELPSFGGDEQMFGAE